MTDLGVDVIQGRGFPVFHPPLVFRDLLVAFLHFLLTFIFICILPGVGRVYVWVLVGRIKKMCGAEVRFSILLCHPTLLLSPKQSPSFISIFLLLVFSFVVDM